MANVSLIEQLILLHFIPYMSILFMSWTEIQVMVSLKFQIRVDEFSLGRHCTFSRLFRGLVLLNTANTVQGFLLYFLESSCPWKDGSCELQPGVFQSTGIC